MASLGRIYHKIDQLYNSWQTNSNQYITWDRGRRTGCIARIKSIKKEIKNNGWRDVTSWTLEVEWDDRKKTLSMNENEWYYACWFENYSGPTVWKWLVRSQKSPSEPVEVTDMLGHIVSVDDIVIYRAKRSTGRYGSSRSLVHFGIVTKVTPKGGVYVQNIVFRSDSDTTEELRIYHKTDLLVVRDGLKDDLVLQRLSV